MKLLKKYFKNIDLFILIDVGFIYRILLLHFFLVASVEANILIAIISGYRTFNSQVIYAESSSAILMHLRM